MEKKYFIINTGSASKKFSLFEGETELCRAHFEGDGNGFIATVTMGNKHDVRNLTAEQFEKGLEHVLEILQKEKIIENKDDIYAIGLRIVAPGDYFQENRIIDVEYMENLKRASEITPLHINPVLDILKYVKEIFPGFPIVGISDSNFHKDIPESARVYAIQKDDAEKYKIKRYGYHGISHTSVLAKMEREYGRIPSKVVLCHLGGGVSVTAVRDGKSINTSMGFTPLSGSIMSTRVGDIDVGAVMYLLRVAGMTFQEAEEYFNTKCGLLGVSGTSADMRELIRLEKEGDLNAAKAIDMFQYEIKKEIGASVAALNGIDALVFSGTIGERSYIMRNRICDGLQSFGIILDQPANEKVETVDAVISLADSPVKVYVLKTEEMKSLAKETASVAS